MKNSILLSLVFLCLFGTSVDAQLWLQEKDNIETAQKFKLKKFERDPSLHISTT